MNCLPPFHLGVSLEISPVLSFGACFFVSPFWLPLSVSFYVLNRTAVTPRLGGVAFCSSRPVGPSGAIFLVTWAGCSGNDPCVSCVGSPVITGSSWLLSHLWVSLTSGWSTMRFNSDYVLQIVVLVLTEQHKTKPNQTHHNSTEKRNRQQQQKQQ